MTPLRVGIVFWGGARLPSMAAARMPTESHTTPNVLCSAQEGNFRGTSSSSKAQKEIRIGGRLQHFLPAWKEITDNQWVLQSVQGHKLEFLSIPPLTFPNPTVQSHMTVEEEAVADSEIRDLLAKGAVVEVCSRKGFQSPVFMVPKRGGRWRPADGQQICYILYQSQRGNQVEVEMWEWCLVRHITVHAEHLPRSQNKEADIESRRVVNSSDWSLDRTVFLEIQSLWGPFSTDLFAARHNSQMPCYFSFHQDPGALALHRTGSSVQPYAFPPFSLIGRILQKLRQDRVWSLILIAPT